MDLNVNNNRPSFGMAVLFADSAKPVIKEQASKLSKKGYAKFWETINGAVERQAENPNNIIVRKTKHRNVLAAEVVDADSATAMKNYVTAQGLLSRNGSLKFLKSAEVRADKLNDVNSRLENLATAEERHFYPGGKMPQAAEESEAVVEG
mgnify:CR=1 FL=1